MVIKINNKILDTNKKINFRKINIRKIIIINNNKAGHNNLKRKILKDADLLSIFM